MTAVVFFVFAAIALAGAVGVVLARNPVHSALLLVVCLVSVGVFFLQQQAQLVFAVQIIVYASAIVVLFLFVIMLLGVDRQEQWAEPIRFQRPAAITLGVVILAEIILLGGGTWATGAHSTRGALERHGGNIRPVAQVLFTDFLWPFELTAALLVIAVVGAVVLARRSGQPVEFVDELEAGAAGDERDEPVP